MESIDINVLFFGSLKTYFGNQQQLSVPKGQQVVEFIDALKEKSPAAAKILASCQVAVNSELEREDFALINSCEIAILPPFSGG